MTGLRSAVAGLLILATIGIVEAAEVRAGDQPQCFVDGKAGTCWPSVSQCQNCCNADLTVCRSPTARLNQGSVRAPLGQFEVLPGTTAEPGEIAQ
jgi:hypothetical protein